MADDVETMSKPGCLALVCLLFAGFTLLIAVVALAIFLMHTDRARVVERWPTTTGVVTTSAVRENLDGSWHELEYGFTVDGAACVGTRISPMGSGMRTVGSLADEFRVGDRVEVSYDPEDPSEAYLETGLGNGVESLAVLGGVPFALSLVVGGFGLYQLRLARRSRS